MPVVPYFFKDTPSYKDTTMKLFHFTYLLNLPDIMREGISRGEVPVSPQLAYCDRPQAANLTKDGNPANQHWRNGSSMNKVAIRLTVEVPRTDLLTFKEAEERFTIPPAWSATLGSLTQRRKWYFALGGVRPDQIQAVERLVNGQYRRLSEAKLEALIAAIERERDKKLTRVLVPGGLFKGATAYRWKAGFSDSWLIDGEC